MDVIVPPSISEDHQPLAMPAICQTQVEQLVIRLPLKAAWIVYRDADQTSHQVFAGAYEPTVAHRCLSPATREPVQADFKSSSTFLPDLPADATTYLYPLSDQPNGADYLLLWSCQSLNAGQKAWVGQQVFLLRQLLRLNQQCQRQQGEITLLEQILQRVGHQLGNPLALIRLSAETLNLNLPPTLYREQVTRICETTDRLKHHLTQLIRCGQRSGLQLASHNLQEILAESLQELRPWFESKQLQSVVATTFVTVAVDRVQLKQVFDNLLSNAIAFSPPGSKVTCEWHVFAHEVLVHVKDQGPGFSEQDLREMFNPYYSRRPGGKGLGLAIAQKIILDHQGRLWAETLPTGGAQFSFILPRPRPG